MSLKGKQTSVSLQDKYYGIQHLVRKKCTQQQIFEELQVSKSAVITWMSKEKSDSIKEAYESFQSSKRKRLRSSYYQDLDLTVFEWFKQNSSLKIPINAPILFNKAEHFAVLHGHTSFKPSNGWIDRWKNVLVLVLLQPMASQKKLIVK